MRSRIVRAPEAAQLLLGLLPILRVSPNKNIPTATLDNDLHTTRLVDWAIKGESLELILEASEDDRVMLARRIQAFALMAYHDPKEIIGRVPAGADERARLFVAMQAISHHAPFDYVKRFREEQKYK
jgi:hypothetical protein